MNTELQTDLSPRPGHESKLWNYHLLFDEKYQRGISMKGSVQIILLKRVKRARENFIIPAVAKFNC